MLIGHAQRLAALLDAHLLIDDGDHGANWNHRRALEWASCQPCRVVVLEDDALPVAENGFIWCGCGTANAEAEGITVSRLDFGVYVITGSAGLASEGWQILPPMDPGGMGELGVVEAEQTESGGLTIRLFKRKYMLSDKGEIIKTKGEPMDVPANSWIDVRLDMPEDSLFNQRMNQVFQL